MSNLPTLYQITDDLIRLMELLNDPDADNDAVIAELDCVEGQLQEKAQNIAALIRNQESLAEQIKEAEKAMERRRKSIESKVANVRDYLIREMNKAQIHKIDSPMFSISIRRNPPSVEIINEDQIPVAFIRKRIVKTVDKKALFDMLREGIEIEGVKLRQDVRVEIK